MDPVLAVLVNARGLITDPNSWGHGQAVRTDDTNGAVSYCVWGALRIGGGDRLAPAESAFVFVETPTAAVTEAAHRLRHYICERFDTLLQETALSPLFRWNDKWATHDDVLKALDRLIADRRAELDLDGDPKDDDLTLDRHEERELVPA